MKLSLKILLFFLLSSGSTSLFAQEYNFRNFSIKDGLPDAIVRTIAQTDDGFLFFGTRSGLAKFDGKKSQNYYIDSGLPNNFIKASHVYQKNKLLLATNFGLSLFNGETFQNFTKADGLRSDTLFVIFKDENRFLIGTIDGISIFIDNKIINNSEFDFFNRKEIHSFEVVEEDYLFVGTNQGLYKIDGNKIVTIIKDAFVKTLEYSTDGTLWCGTNNGAFSYRDGILKKVKKLSGFEVFSILEDNKHQIWFGTNNAIVKYFRNSFKFYTTTSEFKGRICSDIFQDKEQNLWFATNHGVYLFDDEKFVLYDRSSGITSIPWTILERSNKDILVATDGNGVLKLKDEKFIEIDELSELPKSTWSLLEDEKNNLWIATMSGAYRLDAKNNLVHFSSKNGFTDDRILEIDKDENGILWFSTFSKGVFKYDGETFENILMNKIGKSPVYGAVSGFLNETIFYSATGIERIRNKKSLHFYNEETLNLYSYYSMSVDRDNEIFLLGSYERGLILYNHHHSEGESLIRYISTEDGLSENAILFTQFDDNNTTLWIGTNQGLNKLNYQKFIETGKVIVKSYNEYDGFPSYECNQASSLIDSKGNFWYSTPTGVIKYNKKKEKKIDFISTPFISSVEINYKNVELKQFGKPNKNALLKYDNIEFPYFMNNVTFHFSALYFTNPLDVEFSYRLLGSNDEFSPLTKNEYVTFSSLPPGKYTFELISYTQSGSKVSAPIQFLFTIQAPIWKSSFFYLFVFSIIFIAIYFIYRIRTSAIRKKNMELLKLYKENISYQNQLIESEKDYKGLFENAHNTILITDPDTYLIIDANNRAKDLYGYKRKELLDLSIKVLALNPKSTVEFINKVVENKTVRDYRVTHLRKDGTEIILSINASVTNYKGKVAIESVHRDITQEEETKKQLLLAKEAAEKSNKLKSEFLAQISHEIRTPINTVLGYTSLLWEELKDSDNPEVINLYDPIRRSSERIIRTIDLILNMSEISTGTFELDIKDIEISDLLNFIVVDHKQKAKNKGLSLAFINKTDSAILKIDEYTFSQIFVNLVDNAIKYTNEGSINVILSKTESETVIEVQDTGIGISEEYLPEIFDAFSQEQQGYTRKYEGNGLGLALVDNYVEINKGLISIKSKKGVGSTFRVEF